MSQAATAAAESSDSQPSLSHSTSCPSLVPATVRRGCSPHHSCLRRSSHVRHFAHSICDAASVSRDSGAAHKAHLKGSPEVLDKSYGGAIKIPDRNAFRRPNVSLMSRPAAGAVGHDLQRKMSPRRMTSDQQEMRKGARWAFTR